MQLTQYDVIIIGAGASGMMCALTAGKRGRKVLLLDHSQKLGQKILISGGGRCNFTNLTAGPANYVSNNPHFCKSALSRYPSSEFIALIQAHGIAFEERKHGQLFCKNSAQDIVSLLRKECEEAQVSFEMGCNVEKIEKIENKIDYPFELTTNRGTFHCNSLVIATGGLSIPKIGATGFGYDIAKQFGLKLVAPEPALDGFRFSDPALQWFAEISGASLECAITCNGITFRENLLFTHSGLSGPVALQASLHWHNGDTLSIDLLPGFDFFSWFLKKKREGCRSLVKTLLTEHLPSRFVDHYCSQHFPSPLPLPQVSEKALEAFCTGLHAWTIKPCGTIGYNKAEVTRGGVDTDELSSKTLESKKVKGLYFIGEVVDVTGWLGGYNFQWAWSSGSAAGNAV